MTDQILLRIARVSDIQACSALDASYTTDHTWQITEERAARPGAAELTVGLRTVGLPRPRSVVPPDPAAELEAEWERTDLFLIAEGEGPVAYLCATASPPMAWINRIVVDTAYRRAGVGSLLLGSAREWARQNGLRTLIAAPPTKNYPVICLLRARGYAIRGYNERHYANGDIALYLAHDLRDE